MRIAFIGLGVMGYPMAGYLSKTGHDVVVFNRTQSRADDWVLQYGGSSASTPAEAAAAAAIAFCCVGDDNDVRDVILGSNGVLNGIAPGAVIVDHTTASANLARQIHCIAAEKSVDFLDAPVSGGQAGAESGQLTVMAGGDDTAYERAVAVIDSYAKAVTHIGPSGCGQLAKMVNQICIAGIVQGLSEGLDFAVRAGLDPAIVIESISRGAAQSWQMENRWRTMVDGEFDFGFAVDWMRKDLGIALDEAQSNGATLEMTRLVDGFYAEVQKMGGSRWDTSSLIARLSERSAEQSIQG